VENSSVIKWKNSSELRVLLASEDVPLLSVVKTRRDVCVQRRLCRGPPPCRARHREAGGDAVAVLERALADLEAVASDRTQLDTVALAGVVDDGRRSR
jgi:hypothetical protein